MNDTALPLAARIRLDRTRAIAHIRSLAGGSTARYIATSLTQAGIPTPCGRPGAVWRHSSVQRLAAEAGLSLSLGTPADKPMG
jgi:hypothetical protein